MLPSIQNSALTTAFFCCWMIMLLIGFLPPAVTGEEEDSRRSIFVQNVGNSKFGIYWIKPSTREFIFVSTARTVDLGETRHINTFAGHEFAIVEAPSSTTTTLADGDDDDSPNKKNSQAEKDESSDSSSSSSSSSDRLVCTSPTDKSIRYECRKDYIVVPQTKDYSHYYLVDDSMKLVPLERAAAITAVCEENAKKIMRGAGEDKEAMLKGMNELVSCSA